MGDKWIFIFNHCLWNFCGICNAITEEFLFRGFIFKRLIESLGEWPAQIIISGLFLLTHLNNPGMAESVK
ncbi:MAG: CPBP family intramembrane metalloprotease [Bacteroidetes bacterium]|nr:CPBP family intramembrane metalloprotease [Bacteroidota bacterium]